MLNDLAEATKASDGKKKVEADQEQFSFDLR